MIMDLGIGPFEALLIGGMGVLAVAIVKIAFWDRTSRHRKRNSEHNMQ